MTARLRRHWRLAIDLTLYSTLVTLYALSGTVISVPLAAGQLVPLVWRRVAPGTVLAVISAATAAHSLLGMGRAVGYLPVSLAMYTAATHRSPAVRWGMCGAAAVLVTVTGAIRRGPVEGGLLAAVALIVTWLAGVERGEHLRERAEHDRERAEHDRERAEHDRERAEHDRERAERRLVEREAETARARERLARRLHDSLAHTMTVMLVQGEALRATARLAPDDRRRLDTVLGAGRDALAEVRLALAEEHRRDDAATLEERLTALREAGLSVQEGLAEALTVLPVAVRQVVYRLTAEAATNALRHDGPGTTLRASVKDTALRLTTHRPPGAKPPRRAGGGGRYGLRSLETDALAAGGTLTYGPTADGWQVTAEFPAVHAGG
ncbi:histidine kinase [Dactylosporangium sp. NPDC005555]|uniref:sensor histidine kinase n=1 Tax=Dactylosporangium sp. NPDC005555 TaxID=3154889 RepID=UPI0033B656A6